jgi:hypothetical protein
MSSSTEIERYRQAGSDFIVAARSGTARQAPGADGSWSATMIAHHMADADMHFAIRVREILVHENPALTLFDEEKYAEHLAYDKRPIEPALLTIKSIRDETADLLLALPKDAWSRSGTRSDGLKLTIHEIIQKATHHAEEHIAQIKNAL